MFVRESKPAKALKMTQSPYAYIYEGASRSFRTVHLEQELQMVQFCAIRCNCIAIWWVSLVSFAAMTLCIASQEMFIVVHSLSTQSGNFWIHLRPGFKMRNCVVLMKVEFTPCGVGFQVKLTVPLYYYQWYA